MKCVVNIVILIVICDANIVNTVNVKSKFLDRTIESVKSRK